MPLLVFYKEGILSSFTYIKDIVAQWVYPHLLPLAYLRYHQTVYDVGEDILELWVNEPDYIAVEEAESGK